jgi:hypothetical protein
MRPVILNGIEEVATRGDLLDRSIILYVPAIPPEKRQPEATFWAAFHQAQPLMLGALLNAAAAALRTLPSTKISRLPRMADFALWAAAAEGSLGWEPGSALAAYTGNQAAASELALDASVAAAAVLELIEGCAKWSGTASDLLRELNKRSDEGTRRRRAWPQTPRAISNLLRRLAPNLRVVGIEVDFPRTNKARRIDIRKLGRVNVTSVTTFTETPGQEAGS